MKLLVCDKCGDRIAINHDVKQSYLHLTVDRFARRGEKEQLPDSNDIALCSDCSHKLYGWLNNGKTS